MTTPNWGGLVTIRSKKSNGEKPEIPAGFGHPPLFSAGGGEGAAASREAERRNRTGGGRAEAEGIHFIIMPGRVFRRTAAGGASGAEKIEIVWENLLDAVALSCYNA